MEMQIQDLVSAIKKEGIEAAQSEADKIIEQANKTAASILAKAQADADSMIKKAEEHVEILKERARTTADHAKRDAMLFFKKSVQTEFERLLEADVEKAVDTQVLAKLMVAALNGEDPSGYTAEVAAVTEGLQGELAKALGNGLEIKANPNIRTGFKLTARDGSGYFDCSDEELEKILAPFFPQLTV